MAGISEIKCHEMLTTKFSRLTFSFFSSGAVALVRIRALVGVGGEMAVAGTSACLTLRDDFVDGLCVEEDGGLCRFGVSRSCVVPPLPSEADSTSAPEGISRKAGSCASGMHAAITFPI